MLVILIALVGVVLGLDYLLLEPGTRRVLVPMFITYACAIEFVLFFDHDWTQDFSVPANRIFVFLICITVTREFLLTRLRNARLESELVNLVRGLALERVHGADSQRRN